MATHVLQFVFLGNTGFRLPFAHWPTKEADSATLHDLSWKAIFWRLKSNFVVTYCRCDGGESNRGFIKMQFGGKNPERKFHSHQPLYMKNIGLHCRLSSIKYSMCLI